MVIPSLIGHKRDGHALQPAEWSELIREYTAGRVPDYQMSALLMAVVWRGLEPEELAAEAIAELKDVFGELEQVLKLLGPEACT